jgi:hypothetical protein
VITVDYTQLVGFRAEYWLDCAGELGFIVRDALHNDDAAFPPFRSAAVAIRWMRLLEDREAGVTVDEDSIRLAEAFIGHSVRVPTAPVERPKLRVVSG